MKNKGFTMIELLAVIMILGIITTIAIVGVTSYVNGGRDQTYAEHEETLKRATQNYLMDHSEMIPSNKDDNVRIEASALKDESYVEKLEDPRSRTDCVGYSYIKVVKTNENTSANFNSALDYKVCLICKNESGTDTYKSDTCE